MSYKKDLLAGIIDIAVGNSQPAQRAPHEGMVIGEQHVQPRV